MSPATAPIYRTRDKRTGLILEERQGEWTVCASSGLFLMRFKGPNATQRMRRYVSSKPDAGTRHTGRRAA